MNVMDRGFIYVGVLSIVSLAGIAIYVIETAKLGSRPYASVPPIEIFVGTMDSNQCYVSDIMPEVYSVPSTGMPHAIRWTAIGSNHSYTITFSNNNTPLQGSVSSVSVSAGGSSIVQYISSGIEGDFPYTVQNDKNSCTGKALPEPAWVHVSK
jgi:hypothetical protein